jgi:hypothetical protein
MENTKCGMRSAEWKSEMACCLLSSGGIGRRQEEIATYGRFLWIVRFPFRNPHFVFSIPQSAFRIPHFISPRRLLASGCDDHSNDD